MLDTDLYARIRFRGRPQAHPESMVVVGKARFTVLTPRLLRMEWCESGEFEDRCSYAFPTRWTPEPSDFQTHSSGSALTIDTGSLLLSYTGNGERFSPENLSVRLQVNGAPVTWHPGQTDPHNLKGTRRTLDLCMGDAPLSPGLVSRSGWALFDDSRNVLFGDDGWVASRPEHLLQDWYFFGYAHDYKGAIAEYRLFGGETPLIPRFVLGAWWSRYWAYSEQDLRDLVAEFEDHGVPLDVLVIDMDWHTPDGWTGYTWNRELFPDPPAFLRWLHEKGLRVTLNLHPADGVHPHEEVYPAFAKAMGIDPESRAPVPFRIADRDYVRHYFEMLHHPMEEEGVDFWWMDWQQGEISEVRGLDPLPWINHLHFNEIKRRGVRPMLYSRWGGLGNHRYYIGFSGDSYVTWDALRFQPYMTATAANVLYGWWSHDIGGHMGGATEPELYARWVQAGAVSPVLRLHSTKDARAERRPWGYAEPVYQAAKAAFLLRYALIPYLYSSARRAADTGVALCKPMYYEHPEDDSAYAARYQYYLGEELIAAPIVCPRDPATGLARSDVWVPEGIWMAYDTLETFVGPRWIRLLGDLNRIPLLVRSGAILPLAPILELQPGPGLRSGTSAAAVSGDLVLEVFPGVGVGRLYEDDGASEAYRSGEAEWTPLSTRQSDDGQSWTVEVGPVEGRWESSSTQRRTTVRLRGSKRPQRVYVNGAEFNGWRYDDAGLVTIIDTGLRSKHSLLTVSAESEHGMVALGSDHNVRVALRDEHALVQGSAHHASGAAGLSAMAPMVNADLVARRGGPFASIVELSTLEDARLRLGYVVIAAPANGEAFDAEVEFVCSRSGSEETARYQARQVTGPQVVDVPFRYESDCAETTIWRANIDLRWGGEVVRVVHTSKAFFPAVYAYQAHVCRQDDPARPMLADLARCADQISEAHGWFPVRQPLEEATTLTELFVARISDGIWRERVAQGVPQCLYLASRIENTTDRELVLEVVGSDQLEAVLNGEHVSLAPVDNGLRAPIAFREARRSGPLRLHQGANRLLLQSCSQVGRSWGWLVGARWLTPDGQDVVDLSFE